MSGFDQERSMQQQLKDEFAQSYKQMTDPEEQARAQQQKDREQHLSDLQSDAGL